MTKQKTSSIEKKFRGWLAAILAICLVATLIPALVILSRSDEGGGGDVRTDAEFVAALGGDDQAQGASGNITLKKNVELRTPIKVIAGSYTLDLGGFTLTGPAGNTNEGENAIEITSGATLALTGQGTIIGGAGGAAGTGDILGKNGGAAIDNGGILKLVSGAQLTLQGGPGNEGSNNSAGNGGTAVLNRGAMTMDAGIIVGGDGGDNGSGLRGTGGTGLANAAGATVNLNNGRLIGGVGGSGESVTGGTGGLGIENGGNLIMKAGDVFGGLGGEPDANKKKGIQGDGGTALLVTATGDFSMEAGTIQGGSGAEDVAEVKNGGNGGIGLESVGKFEITGGRITGGDSTSKKGQAGAGVVNKQTGRTSTLQNVTVQGGKASTVQDNTDVTAAGGNAITNNGQLTVISSEITGGGAAIGAVGGHGLENNYNVVLIGDSFDGGPKKDGLHVKSGAQTNIQAGVFRKGSVDAGSSIAMESTDSRTVGQLVNKNSVITMNGKNISRDELKLKSYTDAITVSLGPNQFDVTYMLDHLSASGQPVVVTSGEALTVTLIADDGYLPPDAIEVTMGGATLIQNSGYTYNAKQGYMRIANVTGNVTIKATAKVDEENPADPVAGEVVSRPVRDNESTDPIPFLADPKAAAEALLTDAEKTRWKNGTDVAIWTTIKTVESPDDLSYVEGALKGKTLAVCWDITMEKEVGNITVRSREKIDVANAPVRMSLSIPSKFVPTDGTNRKFWIIRVHNGTSAVLEDLDDNAKSVTFETDRFSTYALAYEDITESTTTTTTANTNNTNTNTTNNNNNNTAGGNNNITGGNTNTGNGAGAANGINTGQTNANGTPVQTNADGTPVQTNADGTPVQLDANGNPITGDGQNSKLFWVLGVLSLTTAAGLFAAQRVKKEE